MRRHYMIIVGYQPDVVLTSIHDEIAEHAQSWWHYFENVWIVCTDDPITSWQSRITRLLQDHGHLLLLEIKRSERNGLLPPQAWDWLNGHIH